MRRGSFIVRDRKALDLMKVKRVGARDYDLQSRDGVLVRRYLMREYDQARDRKMIEKGGVKNKFNIHDITL